MSYDQLHQDLPADSVDAEDMARLKTRKRTVQVVVTVHEKDGTAMSETAHAPLPTADYDLIKATHYVSQNAAEKLVQRIAERGAIYHRTPSHD